MEKLVEHKFITQEWIDFVPEAFAEFKDKIGPELLKTESYYPATDKIFKTKEYLEFIDSKLEAPKEMYGKTIFRY